MVIAKVKSSQELSWPQNHLTEKKHSSHETWNSGRNWLGVMFGAMIFIAQIPGH